MYARARAALALAIDWPRFATTVVDARFIDRLAILSLTFFHIPPSFFRSFSLSLPLPHLLLFPSPHVQLAARARASTKQRDTASAALFLNNINAQTQAFASQDSRGHEFDKHAIVRGQQSISTKLALAAARDVCERKIMRILKLYCAVCTFYESEDEFFNLRDKRRLYRISLTLSFSCKYFLKMRALLLYTSLKK